MKKLDYVLGHSQREIQRLIAQAAILRPVTERLLRSLKIGPGMRVLDLGCGAGDVTMLAAEFVGPTGLIVGIDRNREVLTLAAERARAAGLRQIRFEQASVESQCVWECLTPFYQTHFTSIIRGIHPSVSMIGRTRIRPKP